MQLYSLRPSISELLDSEVLGIVVTIRNRRRQTAKVAVDLSKGGGRKTSKTLDDMSIEDLQQVLDNIQKRKEDA